MSDPAEPASPCTGLCVLHPRAGLCAGCLRTMEEITLWRDLGPEARRAILAALPEREGLVRKRPRRPAPAPAAPRRNRPASP